MIATAQAFGRIRTPDRTSNAMQPAAHVTTRICPYCQESFQPSSSRQHVCSRPACRRADATRRTRQALAEKRAVYIQNLRRCHDCGRPTSNYRCKRCWEKLRRDLDILPEEGLPDIEWLSYS